MKSLNEIKSLIDNICRTQFFGVLATSLEDKPYTTLVAFALEEDLKRLFFATPRDTKKYTHLTANSSASFLIHNSSNVPEDITNAVGITISGRAIELSKETASLCVDHYLSKHPQMRDFTLSENTAFVSLEIERFDIVERFQNVTVIDMKLQEESL